MHIHYQIAVLKFLVCMFWGVAGDWRQGLTLESRLPGTHYVVQGWPSRRGKPPISVCHVLGLQLYAATQLPILDS